MSDSKQRGSTAPMWWGISLVLAFTFAAALRFHLVDGSAQAVAAAEEFPQSVRFAEPLN